MAANGWGLDQNVVADFDETQIILLELPACISEKVSAKVTGVKGRDHTLGASSSAACTIKSLWSDCSALYSTNYG